MYSFNKYKLLFGLFCLLFILISQNSMADAKTLKDWISNEFQPSTLTESRTVKGT